MPAPLVGLAVGAAARAVAKKVASNAVKSAATKKLVKEAAKKKPLANPKSGVRVKSAAKQQPNKPNETKMVYKINDSGGRAYNKAIKEYNSMPESGRFGSAAERQAMGIEIMSKAPVGRKVSITGKKLNQAEARKATTPKNINTANPFANRVKINTDPTKPKGIFGPLKKKAAAANTPANRAKAQANVRGLKVANKRINKMEDVPAGVSARFNATNSRLAKEAAKKKITKSKPKNRGK